jgi:hypothetical protein
LDNPNSSTPFAKPTVTTTYKVTITPNSSTGCNDTYIDSVKVNFGSNKNNINPQEICLVSLRYTKNFVIWEKPVSAEIDSFYIWRESDISNIYNKIGAIAYSDSSFFVDYTSNPDIQSNRYTISILDKCGMESAKSNFSHKTMHLSINQGTSANQWNLIWEPYEGFAVNTYKIYRGTTKDNMTLVGTVAGGNTQYSDFSAPSGYVYYQVQVVSPNSCNPTKLWNTSISNIATNNPDEISFYSSSNEVKIFPNPTTGVVNIKFVDKTNQNQEVIITDMIGNIILKETVSTQSIAKINLSSLSNGIYSLTISNSKYKKTEKIVIQK